MSKNDIKLLKYLVVPNLIALLLATAIFYLDNR